MNPSAYITRYPARSDALSVLFTGMLGRPSARPLALRRPGFGALLSFAPGSRLLSYPTSARADTSNLPTEQSREVVGAHYVRVRPSVPTVEPSLLCYSPEVAELLGLSAVDVANAGFLRTVSGAPPEKLECWATAYGASFAGRYGGQRGDGRAISIGQILGLEVQLKGAGVTPFSRRFDGRAVLRSSVREFLASEAMAHLGVATTRALCVVASGDLVSRAWYDDSGRERMTMEPGAVGTRVAPSFLRFGQFELFHQRDETDLLRELAEHALHRDFAHLRIQVPNMHILYSTCTCIAC